MHAGELQREISNLQSVAAAAKQVAASSSGDGHEIMPCEDAVVTSTRERAGTFDNEFELRLGGQVDGEEDGRQREEDHWREVRGNPSVYE